MSVYSNDSKLDLSSIIFDDVLGALGKDLGGVREEVQRLKSLVMDARSPRLMLVGRRGAGKSSLVNALCGQMVAGVGSVLSHTGRPSWYDVHTELGSLRVLDTRGLGDVSRPDDATAENAIDEIKAALKDEYPDAILFLSRAKEVDARIDEDVEGLAQIRDHIRQRHKYKAPVIGLLAQVDELDPKRVEPPYADDLKQENIRVAIGAISAALSKGNMDVVQVLPISTYAEFDENRRVYDNYWNVDQVVHYLLTSLPRCAQLHLARLTRVQAVQRKLARQVAASAAAICGGIAATPIPLADIMPITTVQVGMIGAIAHIGGREWSLKVAGEFIAAMGANVGAAFLLREASRALVKLVFPGGGHLVSAAVAGAGTWAIAEAAIAYYCMGATMDQAREVFKREKKERLEKAESGPDPVGAEL